MSDLYYSPEKYGLRVIGEVEFSSGSYEFDTSVLWQDIETGAFYYADDSGCSCPVPFEGVDRSNIIKVERLQDLLDYFDERRHDSYRYTDDEWSKNDRAQIDSEIAALVSKYREAKR